MTATARNTININRTNINRRNNIITSSMSYAVMDEINN